MKGKNNTLKDATVRKQTVEIALKWLIRINPQYKNVIFNQDAIESLPENDLPKDLMTVQLNEQMDENAPDINTDEVGPNLGPNADAEDAVHD